MPRGPRISRRGRRELRRPAGGAVRRAGARPRSGLEGGGEVDRRRRPDGAHGRRAERFDARGDRYGGGAPGRSGLLGGYRGAGSGSGSGGGSEGRGERRRHCNDVCVGSRERQQGGGTDGDGDGPDGERGRGVGAGRGARGAGREARRRLEGVPRPPGLVPVGRRAEARGSGGRPRAARGRAPPGRADQPPRLGGHRLARRPPAVQAGRALAAARHARPLLPRADLLRDPGARRRRGAPVPDRRVLRDVPEAARGAARGRGCRPEQAGGDSEEGGGVGRQVAEGTAGEEQVPLGGLPRPQGGQCAAFGGPGHVRFDGRGGRRPLGGGLRRGEGSGGRPAAAEAGRREEGQCGAAAWG
mmetsp:Transcript_49550/g.149345  ORF Transcript_49550/g.149345 Transcript_49550/m.149345 type:complete len:357 (+) Transcript_49550:470-1540(+)